MGTSSLELPLSTPSWKEEGEKGAGLTPNPATNLQFPLSKFLITHFTIYINRFIELRIFPVVNFSDSDAPDLRDCLD